MWIYAIYATIVVVSFQLIKLILFYYPKLVGSILWNKEIDTTLFNRTEHDLRRMATYPSQLHNTWYRFTFQDYVQIIVLF